MKSLYLCFTLSLSSFLFVANGFVTLATRTQEKPLPALKMSNEDKNAWSKDAMRFLGAATLASILSLNTAPGPALAESSSKVYNTQLQPSLLVSDAIKTLDMSMPSYGSLSDPKASTENVKELTIDPSKERNPASTPLRGGSGGKKMAGSYAAGPTKADKKKAEIEAKRAAREQFERENVGGRNAEVVDFSAPSYDQSTAQKAKGMFSL